jgi:hypothetical protein
VYLILAIVLVAVVVFLIVIKWRWFLGFAGVKRREGDPESATRKDAERGDGGGG